MFNLDQNQGYFYDEKVINRHINRLKIPTTQDLNIDIKHEKDIIKQEKTNRFLWVAEKSVFGKFLDVHFQLLGDCTGHALSIALTDLFCCKLFFNNELGSLPHEVDHQTLYAGGRVNIGGGVIPAHIDGCYLIWAIEFAQRYGILLRRWYKKAGYDLGNYIKDIGVLWGSPGVGVPQSLFSHAQKHQLKQVAKVTQPEEIIHYVVNLARPVVLASEYRVVLRADEDGFCHPDNNINGHAVAIKGHCVTHKNIPAIIVEESAGGHPLNMPLTYKLSNGKEIERHPGTYLLTYDGFRHLLKRGEAYALLDAKGF